MPDSAHLIILVGLPGSGKSRLTEEYREKGYSVFDDFLGYHKSLRPQGLLSFLDALEDKKLVICNDVFITNPIDRIKIERVLARYPEYKVDWWFYDNDPEQCTKNILADSVRRKDFQTRIDLIKLLAPTYQIPEGSEVIRVFRPS
jgi:hypothetical protein